MLSVREDTLRQDTRF